MSEDGPGADAPAPGWNTEIMGSVVKVTPGWVVAVVPMIYNDRVVLCSRNEWRTGYTAGFCYDKGGSAALAALAWNPEETLNPDGFKKIACDSRVAKKESGGAESE